MVTISKRMRLWHGVSKTEEDLEKFRTQAREALNKPYHFEAKPQVKTWQEGSTDPLDSPFKPFSKLAAPVVVPAPSATVRDKFTQVGSRRLILPIGIGVLALAVLLGWQIFGTFSSDAGIVSPIPKSVQVKSPPAPVSVVPVSSNVVPPGTELQPGGPYTGTGGPDPSAYHMTAPSGTTSTNMTAPSTCPAGMVCKGTALDGSACTVSNPCRVVYSSGLVTTTGQLLTTGATINGQPCTLTNPCVLTH